MSFSVSVSDKADDPWICRDYEETRVEGEILEFEGGPRLGHQRYLPPLGKTRPSYYYPAFGRRRDVHFFVEGGVGSLSPPDSRTLIN